VSEQAQGPRAGPDLLALYDKALPAVYGYLLSRCGNLALAEDLTAETFLAAVAAVNKGTTHEPNAPWLLGIARHKLVDHWRAQAREQSHLRAVAALAGSGPGTEDNDPWDERLDALRAQQVLRALAPQHRAALVLRYLDDLSVPQVAEVLGRTRHATEALIVRARSAFRRAYEAGDAPETGSAREADVSNKDRSSEEGEEGKEWRR
jgi:RNA polymerase sigma-70 factor (ECF subfamily)